MSNKTIVDGIEFELSAYEAVGIAEGFEEAESEEQVRAAWQHLVNNGQAWQLQGFFGRTAAALIEQGVILSRADYEATYGGK